tara:strand:+ start:784 stop:1059 length:276 start_codon:yes stop_codon:yes gene_type:complete
MGAGKKQKTISLTDETWDIVKDKTMNSQNWNFSAWIRAQIRMMHEGMDPVRLDIRHKALVRAVGEQEKDIQTIIFNRSRAIREQATLGDFE